MRVLLLVVMVVLLARPAYAQSGTPNINLLQDAPSKTPEEQEAEEAREKAYKETLKKIPDAKASTDPWGSVRSGDAPKAAPKAAAKTSSPAKPKTKTGSNAN
jgi:hypothetical protein